jgi:uncharacterized protein (DUF58 family)
VTERRPFPLVPRRRPSGLPFGEHAGRRRGQGSDAIGSRAYRPGDAVSTIDWYASAKRSTASGQDEFVVREYASDESPRIVIVADRRPAMAVYPPPLPWLDKAAAAVAAGEAIATAAQVARSDVALLDVAGAGEPLWLPPRRRGPAQIAEALDRKRGFDAGERDLELALAYLLRRRGLLPVGTFVFVFSDFLAPLPEDALTASVTRGWDLVPVVLQDSVWERSFPDVGGVVVPFVDPATGSLLQVRLSHAEARARRERNERRFERLLRLFEAFGLDPVVVDSADPAAVDDAFLAWSDVRKRRRWVR